MAIRLSTLTILVLLAATGSILAQERITISPYAGAHFADEDQFLGESGGVKREIDDAPILGVRVALPLTDRWRAELTYGRAAVDMVLRVPTIESPDPIEIVRERHVLHRIEAGILWHLLAGRSVRPFFTLAPGVAVVRADAEFFEMDLGEEETTTELAVAIGGGVVLPLDERFGIRADVRDHLRFCRDLCVDDQTLHELELSVGIEIGL